MLSELGFTDWACSLPRFKIGGLLFGYGTCLLGPGGKSGTRRYHLTNRVREGNSCLLLAWPARRSRDGNPCLLQQDLFLSYQTCNLLMDLFVFPCPPWSPTSPSPKIELKLLITNALFLSRKVFLFIGVCFIMKVSMGLLQVRIDGRIFIIKLILARPWRSSQVGVTRVQQELKMHTDDPVNRTDEPIIYDDNLKNMCGWPDIWLLK